MRIGLQTTHLKTMEHFENNYKQEEQQKKTQHE